ncbi:hypothetical protein CFC35_28240 [Streptomyces sp. FBKL.4005]|uniref:hypothetical protein n=1 Tax=Streptomyces sp. FBKL.4005 TaxID=2015515 RepID=UPI000B95E30A|nr:hypothetical protein [Streptomyces sp. FBKL.4005]OYP17901.1 hypothetical protein CFC35_28240 [Streptomyces sp. FBKL.4005]
MNLGELLLTSAAGTTSPGTFDHHHVQAASDRWARKRGGLRDGEHVPVLRARAGSPHGYPRRWGRYAILYCTHCRRNHHHGALDWLRPGDLVDRHAHCGDTPEGYGRTGYLLLIQKFPSVRTYRRDLLRSPVVPGVPEGRYERREGGWRLLD